jgi:mono/diheme cytochrome c family protein
MSLRSFFAPLSVLLLCAGTGTPAIADDSAYIEQGKGVYLNHCEHCHGKSGAGDGFLVGALKVKPADLTRLDSQSCVARKVLGAVLGRHKSGYDNSKMPLLKESLSLEEVYAVSAYVESLQR